MNGQKIFLEPGALKRLDQILSSVEAPKVFAVLDGPAYQHSGAQAQIAGLFSHYGTTIFSEFEPNPKLDHVNRGIELYRRSSPNVVVAIGGGTAIDMSKLISCLAHGNDPATIVRGTLPVPSRNGLLVVVPTTAGTGSEATQFAVVYVDGTKFSLDHPSLLPDVAIIDPELMLTLPAPVTAATGLDALCQAIESIWAVSANEESIPWACEAIQLTIAHLESATLHPTLADRDAMCRAAHVAGKAINVTRTTACHALSYAMTSNHGIPHGIAVALTLAPMLRFNAQVTENDCTDPQGPAAVRARIATILNALNCDSIEAACTKILRLLTELGCPKTLAEAGVTDAGDLQRIVDSVNVQRMRNNPRRTTPASLFQVLVSDR